MAKVRMYLLMPDGDLEPFSDAPLTHYGTCPGVGDIICLTQFREKADTYIVHSRYFFDALDPKQGWAIVLREIDQSEPTAAAIRAWNDDDEWDRKLDEEEAAEVRRKQAEDWERLQLIIGKTPSEFSLNLREENAIKSLRRRGVGVKVPCRAFEDFGQGTRKSLLDRRFVSLYPGASGKFGDDEIALTAEGHEAFKKLQEHRKKVEAARKGKSATK